MLHERKDSRYVATNLPKTPLRLSIGSVNTPLGAIWITASETGLRVVTVPGAMRDECLAVATRKGKLDAEVVDGGPHIDQAVSELTEYFDGELREFTVPLDLQGTPFQQQVWSAVRAVSYGDTATYREIALQIGSPLAYRAVGAANGANPAAIIIPCHRLVGTTGGLRGYAGGLHQKQALLDLEARSLRA